MKSKIPVVLAASSAFVAVGCAAALFCTLGAVGRYERTHNVKILFAETPSATNAVAKAASAAAPQKVTEKPKKEEPIDRNAPLKVLKVAYGGGAELEVFLSGRPDMESARHYIEASPLREGAVGLRYRSRGGDSRIVVTGDFAFRTNVTLRVRKGLPAYGGVSADPSGARSLSDDFTYVFQRADLPPRVAFADKGRYLPPLGSRSVAVETVNASKIHAEVRRVEPRNVVQLLAREEDVYSNYCSRSWWEDTKGADSEDTGELAGEPAVCDVECANIPNETARTAIPVSSGDGGAANGIYLVTVRNGDKPRDGYSWNIARSTANVNRYRVVCLTDLGLSVRSCGGETGVWVTSFKTGRPVAGCRIEAFSTANIKVAEGVTDAGGWCVLSRVAKGEPFVVTASTADDMSFLAMRDSMKVDETYENGARDGYLSAGECTAFVWTERGIYRHDEKIFLHCILRNGKRVAPKPFPVEVTLVSPDGGLLSRRTLMPDANGAFSCETLSVPGDQPSGEWTINVRTPGGKGRVLGRRSVKVEEFAPPQIRVKVSVPAGATPQTFSFGV